MDAKKGRPTKYTDDMPDKILKSMSNGMSLMRFAKLINVNPDTIYEWIKVHPAFSDAFSKGKAFCEAHWEEWLVNNFDNKNVNSGLVKLFMANRFNWREKKESQHNVNISQEEAIKELA